MYIIYIYIYKTGLLIIRPPLSLKLPLVNQVV